MLYFISGLSGIGVGIFVGADSSRQFGIFAAIAGALVGALVGLGLAWLHWRVGSWLVGPRQPEANSQAGRVQAWICEQVYALGMTFGWMFSWVGTLLTAAFLFQTRAPKPNELSRGQCLALFSSIALFSYLLLWGTQRFVTWIESRHRRPEEESR
jgi:hypothetical protein